MLPLNTDILILRTSVIFVENLFQLSFELIMKTSIISDLRLLGNGLLSHMLSTKLQ